MIDPFIQEEWNVLCERVKQTAEKLAERQGRDPGEFSSAAEKFASQDAPRKYNELLERYSEAATLAVEWQQAASPSNG